LIQRSNRNNRFNYKKLTKANVEWLATHYCKHGKPYTEHPSCFFNEKPDTSPIQERVGFLDIETSNLHAPFGYVLSWCIKEKDGGLAGTHITAEEFEAEKNSRLPTKVRIDKRVIREFTKEAKRYDKLVVYYGKNRRHDIPFLRHRCIKLGLDFPLYGEVFCVDMYDWAKNFLKMPYGRYSLWSVCTELGIKAKGTKCPMYYWPKASLGHMGAVETIYKHNIDDVVCLEPLYNYLEPFARRMRTSA